MAKIFFLIRATRSLSDRETSIGSILPSFDGGGDGSALGLACHG